MDVALHTGEKYRRCGYLGFSSLSFCMPPTDGWLNFASCTHALLLDSLLFMLSRLYGLCCDSICTEKPLSSLQEIFRTQTEVASALATSILCSIPLGQDVFFLLLLDQTASST